MKTTLTKSGLLLTSLLLAGCEVANIGDNRGITDAGLDGGKLQDGRANLWTDPDGCQHWYIDDGLEGYMTPRMNPDGTARCSERGTIVGKNGAKIMIEPEPTP